MTSPLEALFTQWLGACVARDAATFLALQAPDAWLVVGRDVQRREVVSEAALAAAWAAVPASAIAFLQAATLQHVVEAGALGTVATFAHAALPEMHLVLGARQVAGAWHVVWASLIPAATPVTFELGQVLMLADFPYLDNAATPLMASWLEVAYWRNLGGSRPTLAVLPDARFGCQGSSMCCRATWAVDQPPIAQAVLDAIPWGDEDADLRGLQLGPGKAGTLRLKASGQACAYLDGAGRCRIHKRLGQPVFAACTAYPYYFAETPEGVVAVASISCPSARAGLGPLLSDNQDDIQHRFARAGTSARPDGFRLARGCEVEWAAFRDAEAALRDDLRAADQPLARRLWLGARRVAALAAGAAVTPLDWAAEPVLPAADGSGETALAMRGLMLALFAKLDPQFGCLGDPTAVPRALRQPELLPRFLEHVQFAKIFSYPFDLATSQAMNSLLAHAVGVLAAQHDGVLPEALWNALGIHVMHGVMGLPILVEDLPAIVYALGQPALAVELARLAVLEERG